MAQANAVFSGVLDVQPTLNAAGQQTGMEIKQAGSAFNLTVACGSLVSQRFTLVNINDVQGLSIGNLSNGLFLLVVASQVVKLTQLQFAIGGGAQIIYGQIIALMGQDATNGITQVTVVAMHPATVVDYMIGGLP